MAEFCSKCAHKFGMKSDTAPLLCEGCGQYFEKKRTPLLWYALLAIAIVVLIFIIQS